MTERTLVQSAVKTRETGAHEKHEASEGQPPAKILPAKASLTKVWNDYERASTDLAEAGAHLARVESDEQVALNDETLSVDESSDKIAFCQRQKGIYGSRLASREATKKKLLGDLKVAMLAAHAEYSNLLRAEHSRRYEALSKRVIIAGRLIEGHFLQRSMDAMLAHSALIDEVRRAEISHQAILVLEGFAQLEGMCQRLLAAYETVTNFGRQEL